MSEQALAEITDLPPVCITLTDYNVTLATEAAMMEATLDYIPLGDGDICSMENELLQLRRDKYKLIKYLEKCKCQTGELDRVRERWCNLDFKYKLLMDMWALRALDTETENSPYPTPRKDPDDSPKKKDPDDSPKKKKDPDHSPKKKRDTDHSPKKKDTDYSDQKPRSPKKEMESSPRREHDQNPPTPRKEHHDHFTRKEALPDFSMTKKTKTTKGPKSPKSVTH